MNQLPGGRNGGHWLQSGEGETQVGGVEAYYGRVGLRERQGRQVGEAWI